MMNICIIGSSKTGTTALYSSVWNSMSTAAPRCYGLMEKHDARLFMNLQRLAPDTPIVAKLLLTNSAFDTPTVKAFDRRLLTVRDPRDTLVSAALYNPVRKVGRGLAPDALETFLQMLREKEADPSSHDFMDILVQSFATIGETVDRTTDFSRRYRLALWAQSKFDCLGARYEDFVHGDFAKISEYIDLPLESSNPSDYSSHVVRSKTSGDWRNWFTPADVDLFRPVMAEYMSRFGYSDDWGLPQSQVVQPATASQYVTGAIEKRRKQIELNSRNDMSADTLQQLRDRADEGAANAAYNLAKALESSSEPDRHAEEIFERLRFAACSGHVRAMRRLVSLYEDGVRVAPDPVEARRWRGEAKAETERLQLLEQVENHPGSDESPRALGARARVVLRRPLGTMAKLLPESVASSRTAEWLRERLR